MNENAAAAGKDMATWARPFLIKLPQSIELAKTYDRKPILIHEIWTLVDDPIKFNYPKRVESTTGRKAAVFP